MLRNKGEKGTIYSYVFFRRWRTQHNRTHPNPVMNAQRRNSPKNGNIKINGLAAAVAVPTSMRTCSSREMECKYIAQQQCHGREGNALA